MGRRSIEVCDFCKSQGDECFTEHVKCCGKDACKRCRVELTEIDNYDVNDYHFYCRAHWKRYSSEIMSFIDRIVW